MERYCTTRYRMLHFEPRTKRYTRPVAAIVYKQKLNREEANLVNAWSSQFRQLYCVKNNILQMLQWLTSHIKFGWVDMTQVQTSTKKTYQKVQIILVIAPLILF